MPYEPIRCPTCGSTKTIAAENKRFYCASCDGWFVWTDQAHAKEIEPSQQFVEALKEELRELKESLANKQQSDSAKDVKTPFESIVFPSAPDSEPNSLHIDPNFVTPSFSQSSKSSSSPGEGHELAIGITVVMCLALAFVLLVKPSAHTIDSPKPPISETQTLPERLVGRWKMKVEYTDDGLVKFAEMMGKLPDLNYSQSLKYLKEESRQSLHDSRTFVSINSDGSGSKHVLINNVLVDFGQFDTRPTRWVCLREDGNLLQMKSVGGDSESRFEIEFRGPDFFELRHLNEETKRHIVRALYLKVDE